MVFLIPEKNWVLNIKKEEKENWVLNLRENSSQNKTFQKSIKKSQDEITWFYYDHSNLKKKISSLLLIIVIILSSSLLVLFGWTILSFSQVRVSPNFEKSTLENETIILEGNINIKNDQFYSLPINKLEIEISLLSDSNELKRYNLKRKHLSDENLTFDIDILWTLSQTQLATLNGTTNRIAINIKITQLYTPISITSIQEVDFE